MFRLLQRTNICRKTFEISLKIIQRNSGLLMLFCNATGVPRGGDTRWGRVLSRLPEDSGNKSAAVGGSCLGFGFRVVAQPALAYAVDFCTVDSELLLALD